MGGRGSASNRPRYEEVPFPYLGATGYVLRSDPSVYVPRESVEAASEAAGREVDRLYRQMRGLHYGKPRRNALMDEQDRWHDVDWEASGVLLQVGDEGRAWMPVREVGR